MLVRRRVLVLVLVLSLVPWTGGPAGTAVVDAAAAGAAGGAAGTVLAWGKDDSGQLGDGIVGTPSADPTPLTVVGVSGVVALAAGTSHTLALRADGTVWAWGSDAFGQLGDGTLGSPTNAPTPQQVPGLTHITAIAAGGSHGLALQADGTLLAWGQDNAGQLGDGTATPNTGTPQAVIGVGGSGTLGNVKAIAAGAQYSLALRSDGTLVSWGRHDSGQLGRATATTCTPGPFACDPTPGVVALPGGAVVKAIAAGAAHALALKTDGLLLSWGEDGAGQLGDGAAGADNPTPSAVSLPGGTLVTAIAGAVAGSHSLALTSVGTVLAWGTDSNGQLGDGTIGSPNPQPTPTLVSLPGGVLATGIAASVTSSAALTSRGRVVTWGADTNGELGDGTTGSPDPQPTPQLVPNLYNAIALVTGGNHLLALTQPTTLLAWGADDSGQLGDGTVGTPNTVATPQRVPGLTGVVGMAAGAVHTVALLGDGTLLAWGHNAFGELGDGTTGVSTPVAIPQPVTVLTNVVAIAAGGFHTLALKSDGTVWSWGANGSGQLGRGAIPTNSGTPAQVSGVTGVVAIAAGGSHSLALKSDGTVVAWGDDVDGQLGDGTIGTPNNDITPSAVVALTGVVALAAGGFHSLAVKSDGTVWAWGADTSGQLGDGTLGTPDAVATPQQVPGLTGIQAIAAGRLHSLALKTDGAIVAWGDDSTGQLGDGTIGSPVNNPTPQAVPGVGGIVALAAGPEWTLALRQDGTVWAWGRDDSGQLGDGTLGMPNVVATPQPVPGLTNIVALAASQDRVGLALRGAASALDWGDDSSGQLGDGVANGGTNQTPQVVPGLGTARQLSGSATHSFALAAHGTLLGWGSNGCLQLGHGLTADRGVWALAQPLPSLTDVVAVAAGNCFTLALKADGTVWAWGRDDEGELGDGTVGTPINVATPQPVSGLDKVVAIVAEAFGSRALRADGTVWTWGSDNNGQLGRNTAGLDSPTAAQVTIAAPGIIALAAGNNHVLALKGDGTLVAWGRDTEGQLGDGSAGPTTNLTPQAVTVVSGAVAIATTVDASFALNVDGTVWSWGGNSLATLGRGTIGTSSATPAQVPGLSQLAALTGGAGHATARQANGQLWSWGANNAGQLGRTTGSPCSGGTTACDLTPTLVPGLSGVAALGVSNGVSTHTLALVAASTASTAPSSLPFAARGVGSTGAAQNVTVSHTGPGTLLVMQSFIGGANAADFAIGTTTCTPGPLASGGTCQLGVTFTPGAAGSRAATLTLSTSTAGAPLTIALSGTGLGAFTLTTGSAGTGTGTVSPAGATPQTDGSVVNVTASPTGGSTFAGWTLDNVAAGTTNPLPVTMAADHAVVATFTAPVPSPSPSPSPSASPSPSPSPAPTVTLTLSTAGTGSGTATPLGTTTYPQHTVVTLTASPAAGSTFTGWSLGGTLVSWRPSVTLTMEADHAVVATFAPTPAFGDVAAGQPFTDPIAQLAARGIVKGCDQGAVPPLFCPSDPTLRHQMAALIVRGIPGWVDETGLPTFTDNTDDTELMTRVATLQRHNVVRGYQDDVCLEQGKTPPCYGPLDTVRYGQVMLFIARAMVEKGYWAVQPDDRTIFPDQNGAPGAPADDQQTRDHQMVVTYVHYAGAPPDVADLHAPFRVAGVAPGGWGDASDRAWFARAFWPALESYFGQDNLP